MTASSRPLTILLVEDNELNRDMLSRRLQRRGFAIVEAGDGQEALQKASADRPDLVLMDMNLPMMNGWEATMRLKADPATAAIPVIALTAHALSSDRDRALSVGCDAFESKPIDLDRLLTTISHLTGRVNLR